MIEVHYIRRSPAIRHIPSDLEGGERTDSVPLDQLVDGDSSAGQFIPSERNSGLSAESFFHTLKFWGIYQNLPVAQYSSLVVIRGDSLEWYQRDGEHFRKREESATQDWPFHFGNVLETLYHALDKDVERPSKLLVIAHEGKKSVIGPIVADYSATGSS